MTYGWDLGDGDTGTGVAPSHTYTAAGTYAVTLMVNDGTLDSAPDVTTATITPNPMNHAPVAADDGYSMDEDTALTVAAPGVLGNDTDEDGDALTAVL